MVKEVGQEGWKGTWKGQEVRKGIGLDEHDMDVGGIGSPSLCLSGGHDSSQVCLTQTSNCNFPSIKVTNRSGRAASHWSSFCFLRASLFAKPLALLRRKIQEGACLKGLEWGSLMTTPAPHCANAHHDTSPHWVTIVIHG